ncbi:MAG: DMT family transporter [Candidatus Binatia bacterium]|jgi:drug/metabolite transporter (DMT)-like permease|nr:DMT family transporter [Candidatus Binatia bacterium]|tara:strand:+ start:60 stop:920 length:861 start_codon:yes stop_codon:yes gene_type:complete
MRLEFVAILSAMGWAMDSILVRMGARFSDVFAAAFLSFLVTALCLWTYIVFSFPLDLVWNPAVIYFVMSGLLQPLLARILYYEGMMRLGVSRAGTLRGTGPLFAVILAVIFLHERPGISVYAGVILTVLGVGLISYRRGAEGDWRLFDVVFPLGAGLVAAVSQNLRRTGLLIIPNPFIGAAVTTTTSLVIFSISLLVLGKVRLLRVDKKSVPFFAVASLISAGAQFLVFYSLTWADVSVMIPLINTTPLFTVLFSALFLRDLETVTSRVLIGTVVLVAGMVFIINR